MIQRIEVGDTVEITLPYSEVCMHMMIAGRKHKVELCENGIGGAYARIYWENGSESPVTTGEAGIYHDDYGYYVHSEV